MELNEDRPFHTCEGMAQLHPTPRYMVERGVDIRDGRELQVVMLVIQHSYGEVATQVDYCPWCAQMLTSTPLSGMQWRSVGDMTAYNEYRRRWVKQGIAGAPLDLERFNVLMSEWREIEFLLPHARIENVEGLYRRKQTLRDKLALGVVIERDEPAEPVVERQLEGYEPFVSD